MTYLTKKNFYWMHLSIVCLMAVFPPLIMREIVEFIELYKLIIIGSLWKLSVLMETLTCTANSYHMIYHVLRKLMQNCSHNEFRFSRTIGTRFQFFF